MLGSQGQMEGLRPSTPEERDPGLAIVEEIEEPQADGPVRRGGRPFPDSWELINEARDARSRHLDRAVRGDVADDDESPQAIHIHTDYVPRRLSEEEQRRGLEAFARLQRFGEEILARHGGEPFPSAWEIINAQRDQRSRDLG